LRRQSQWQPLSLTHDHFAALTPAAPCCSTPQIVWMCWPAGDKQKQQRALPELRKKSIFVSSSNQPPSMWRAVKLVHPYQIAAFIPPLITATILPMCMSSQVGQVRG
jgi:hypothetical protein